MAQPSMSESDRYAELSRELIRRAGEYLRSGDRIQASEKTWGSVAQQMKAIAERRGWNHGGHRLLIDIARQVADERGRPDWLLGFHAAKDLHVNFYDDLMELDSIEVILDNSRSLLLELEQVRMDNPPAFTPGTREQRRRWQRLTGEDQL